MASKLCQNYCLLSTVCLYAYFEVLRSHPNLLVSGPSLSTWKLFLSDILFQIQLKWCSEAPSSLRLYSGLCLGDITLFSLEKAELLRSQGLQMTVKSQSFLAWRGLKVSTLKQTPKTASRAQPHLCFVEMDAGRPQVKSSLPLDKTHDLQLSCVPSSSITFMYTISLLPLLQHPLLKPFILLNSFWFAFSWWQTGPSK